MPTAFHPDPNASPAEAAAAHVAWMAANCVKRELPADDPAQVAAAEREAAYTAELKRVAASSAERWTDEELDQQIITAEGVAMYFSGWSHSDDYRRAKITLNALTAEKLMRETAARLRASGERMAAAVKRAA
jgi:hypothetical protein